MSNLVVVEESKAIQQRQTFFQMKPKEQVEYATEIANCLTDIIEKQKLFTVIQGKKYVKAEGWQTLGTFLGITPRENRVLRLDDGSYEAMVDLINVANGITVGGASALCSVNEKRWGAADDYARRSMAITRAIGKAYRSAFAWIITLAGYEPTNAEEMPREEKHEPKSEIYTGTDFQQEKIRVILKKKAVPEDLWQSVHDKLLDRPGSEIYKVIDECQKN